MTPATSPNLTLKCLPGIRVTFDLQTGTPDSIVQFTVTGNRKNKRKSYPLIVAGIVQTFDEDLLDKASVTVKDYIPEKLSTEEFDSKCRISFLRRGIVKDEKTDPEVSVIATLTDTMIYTI